MRTLDSLPKRSGRSATYDWDSILNGNVNVLAKGDDFDCEVKSFESQARRTAAERGLKVEIRTGPNDDLADGELAIQASPVDEDAVEDTDAVEVQEDAPAFA